MRIIEAVLDDAALRDYAKHHFERDKRLMVTWEGMQSNAQSCKAGNHIFQVTKTSGLNRVNDGLYVVVSKLYYDDTAAFVEVWLPPSGKHGDFFLRNTGGWKVAQRSLWEE